MEIKLEQDMVSKESVFISGHMGIEILLRYRQCGNERSEEGC